MPQVPQSEARTKRVAKKETKNVKVDEGHAKKVIANVAVIKSAVSDNATAETSSVAVVDTNVVENAEVAGNVAHEAVVTVPVIVTAPSRGTRRYMSRRTVAKHALRSPS